MGYVAGVDNNTAPFSVSIVACMKPIAFLLILIAAAMPAYSTGTLFVRPLNSNQTHAAMSIVSYDAQAVITDHVATTKVLQVFKNELNQRVESTLIFPLPQGAIITEMAYVFNGRRYVASVQERQFAQAKYDDKVRRLIDPALLKEIGDNIFQLNIAPIDPLSDVIVDITYAEVMPYVLGVVSYTHLTKTAGASRQPLRRVSITADVTSSKNIVSIVPSRPGSQAVDVRHVSNTRKVVTFGDEGILPDKNFRIDITHENTSLDMVVLTYTPNASDSMGSEGFFGSFVTLPDEGVATLPRSIVVVADVSSSMTPQRMEHLRSALHSFLDALSPGDHFNIVSFSTGVVSMKPDLVPAHEQNILDAREFVETRVAMGLTNISEALRQTLQMTFLEGTSKSVVFLTDGAPSWGIVDNAAIMDSARTWNRSQARIFPIAIGNEPSDALLRGIAKATGGFLTRIDADDSIPSLVALHLRRISMPLLEQPRITYGSLQTRDVFPTILPTISVGERILQLGRFTNAGTHTVSLAATLNGISTQRDVEIPFGDGNSQTLAVARLWAQAKVQALLDEIARVGEVDELVKEIIRLSIQFNILTKYTALYADPDEDTGTPTGIHRPDERPIEIVSIRCSPNPATSHVLLSVQLPERAFGERVEVRLLDIVGRVVAVLYDDITTGRELTLEVNLSTYETDLTPGMYVVHVRTPKGSTSQTLFIQ